MLYDRGHLFALRLAGEAGSPAAVRAALVRMATGAESFPAQETQGARFLRAFTAIPPARLAAAHEAAIVRGEPILLPPDLLGRCGTIHMREQPVYASGYTVEDRDGGTYFATVDEASPAWAAGLRPGMRYVKRESFRPGDSSVPIVMRVADAAGERVLTWLPQGRETVRFQRLELDERADPARCEAELAGEG